jgi:hypothetical protein
MFGQDQNTLRIHWKSLWIEDMRGASFEQGFYTFYRVYSLLHGSIWLLVAEIMLQSLFRNT